MNIPDATLEMVHRYFGFAALPNYSGTGAIMERDPYRLTRERLSTQWGVVDDTDYNYDLSFVYILQNHPRSNMLVRLSFVGPYALVLEAGVVVHPPDICEILEAHGFLVMGQDILDQPVEIWSPELDGYLYEFLFEFDLGPPWNRR